MKITEFGAGKITAQNTTQDVKPGETERQAKKLGLMNGKPRLLHKTAAKNSDPNTLMNLGIGEGVDMSSLKPFVKFCIKSLELKSVPKIIITKKKLDGTFGYYDTDAKTLTVSSSDRHLADIMRTLAHELVHVKQFVKGEVSKKNLVLISNTLKGMQTESTNYWDNPMEIEAFGRTPGLVHRWITR